MDDNGHIFSLYPLRDKRDESTPKTSVHFVTNKAVSRASHNCHEPVSPFVQDEQVFDIEENPKHHSQRK